MANIFKHCYTTQNRALKPWKEQLTQTYVTIFEKHFRWSSKNLKKILRMSLSDTHRWLGSGRWLSLSALSLRRVQCLSRWNHMSSEVISFVSFCKSKFNEHSKINDIDHLMPCNYLQFYSLEMLVTWYLKTCLSLCYLNSGCGYVFVTTVIPPRAKSFPRCKKTLSMFFLLSLHQSLQSEKYSLSYNISAGNVLQTLIKRSKFHVSSYAMFA